MIIVETACVSGKFCDADKFVPAAVYTFRQQNSVLLARVEGVVPRLRVWQQPVKVTAFAQVHDQILGGALRQEPRREVFVVQQFREIWAGCDAEFESCERGALGEARSGPHNRNMRDAIERRVFGHK
jgi:hypothetical protein